MDKYRPNRKNIALLRETILGFCRSLSPPKIILPSNVGNVFPEATERHE